MSSVQRHRIIWIVCPTCGAEGIGPDFITRDWDGETYGFRCGHEHHLDPNQGGAQTYLQATEPGEGEA